ncbi:uncharacterized protein LOC123319244 isoform X2 [Coccinella septempunctata]|uniref:uncharacterized protein LOC123319244 isoform X2 n=1 Tax=Coccinella septempunctata TaxID=41139 RepID=UPI001D069E0B|nr:uncharacterized protein LOC123319244 isoform X2 [Coccinella septempunctata]
MNEQVSRTFCQATLTIFIGNKYFFVANHHGTGTSLFIISCMPIQETYIDTPQKLSKIETLRLAANYISALSEMLQENQPMESERYIQILSKNLSQSTANLIANSVIKNSVTNIWEERTKMYCTNSKIFNYHNKTNNQWISSYNSFHDYCWSPYRFDAFWFCSDEDGTNYKCYDKDFDFIGDNFIYSRCNC